MADVRLMVVDLSHYDMVTDFGAAKAAGVAGIIHKASQGAGYRDPAYASRRPQAIAAGLLWGAYHFGTSAPVPQQIDNFLAAAAPDAATLLALDYEPNGNDTMSLDQARQFLAGVGEKIGRTPVLYSGSLIKQTLGRHVDDFFAGHRLWLSEYCTQPVLPASWQHYWLWQYSDGASGPPPRTVAGIPGNAAGEIDCNTFAGSGDQLAAQWAGPVATAQAASGSGASS